MEVVGQGIVADLQRARSWPWERPGMGVKTGMRPRALLQLERLGTGSFDCAGERRRGYGAGRAEEGMRETEEAETRKEGVERCQGLWCKRLRLELLDPRSTVKNSWTIWIWFHSFSA